MGLPEDREEIARRYGFPSFAELLDASEKLPMTRGDTQQSYVAKHLNGHWFVWEDVGGAWPEGVSHARLFRVIGVKRDGVRITLLRGAPRDIADRVAKNLLDDNSYERFEIEEDRDGFE